MLDVTIKRRARDMLDVTIKPRDRDKLGISAELFDFAKVTRS